MTIKPLNNCSLQPPFHRVQEGISIVKTDTSRRLLVEQPVAAFIHTLDSKWLKGLPHPPLSGERMRLLFEESSWKWQSPGYYEIAFQPVLSVVTKGCMHL